MNRAEYNEIRQKLEGYVGLWNTKNYDAAAAIFSPKVTFFTSTSLTMPDGAQHSLFGIRDFLTDFPHTDTLSAELLNYTCRTCCSKAVTYAEAVCKAANEDGDTFTFNMQMLAAWRKTPQGWLIFDLKQEAIPGSGTLKDVFAAKWSLDTDGTRMLMIQGETDSPWNQIPEDEAPLTEEERALDCLTKYFYGLEQEALQHCYTALSQNLGAYSDTGEGEQRRMMLAAAKAQRRTHKYEPHALKVSTITLDSDRAFIKADQLLETLPDYLDPAKQYSCNRQTIELQKEADGWKIVYMDAYPGIYQL